MTDRELMQMALDALDYVGYVYTTEEENQEVEQAIEALRTALAQPEKTDMQIGITYEEANPHVHAVNISQERVHKTEKNEHEPVAWVYPEGLEAFKNGKCWTAYGTHQNEQMSPLYENLPKIEQEPYGWVTFNAYGEEDDVWYENPEGQLLEGWTYKPLYDTTPQKKEWVGLTDVELAKFSDAKLGSYDLCLEVEAKLKEKNET